MNNNAREVSFEPRMVADLDCPDIALECGFDSVQSFNADFDEDFSYYFILFRDGNPDRIWGSFSTYWHAKVFEISNKLF